MTHDYADGFPRDWPFHPTVEQLGDLNEKRDHWGLPVMELEHITRASQWFRACAEIDECADEASLRSIRGEE